MIPENKNLISVVSMGMMCRNCDKYIGTINIECAFKDFEKVGMRMREFLVNIGSFPVCDVCSTVDTVYQGPVVRPK
jgi:hypothetical protein